MDIGCSASTHHHHSHQHRRRQRLSKKYKNPRENNNPLHRLKVFTTTSSLLERDPLFISSSDCNNNNLTIFSQQLGYSLLSSHCCNSL